MDIISLILGAIVGFFIGKYYSVIINAINEIKKQNKINQIKQIHATQTQVLSREDFLIK